MQGNIGVLDSILDFLQYFHKNLSYFIAYMLGNLIMKSKFALICDIFSELTEA